MYGGGRERDAVRLAPAIRGRAARSGDRSRKRSGRAALLERHHGAAQGRDAHASNLVANICQTVAALHTSEDDRVAAVLPFFHIYGLVVVLNTSLRCGATLVTMPRFELPAFLSMLQEHRITRAYAVPPIVLALAKHPLVDEFDLSSVEYVLSGAAPLSADLDGVRRPSARDARGTA